MASKITPTTLPARPGSPHATQTSMHTRPPSADPQGMPDRDGAYNVRSVPIRLYLPEGPVLQDLAPPVLEDGGCLLSTTPLEVPLYGRLSPQTPLPPPATALRASKPRTPRTFAVPADDPMPTQVHPTPSRICSLCTCHFFFLPRAPVPVRRSHMRYFRG